MNLPALSDNAAAAPLGQGATTLPVVSTMFAATPPAPCWLHFCTVARPCKARGLLRPLRPTATTLGAFSCKVVFDAAQSSATYAWCQRSLLPVFVVLVVI